MLIEESFFSDIEIQEKIIMRNICDKSWFICFLLIGIHVWTGHSYGDIESSTDDNDTNTSERVTFESLIETMHVNRRFKRAAAVVTGKYFFDLKRKNFVFNIIGDTTEATTQSPTTSTAVYILTIDTDSSNNF
jgi:hypothetical protein